MNIQITGHHVEVTAAIRDYVNGKLDRVTRPLYPIDWNDQAPSSRSS